MMGRTRAGSAPWKKGGSWPSVCKMARSQASTGNLQGDKYSEISNPFGTSAREKGQDSREHSQDGVIIIPRRIHLPATKANASSTLKWRLAILEQLAIGACCCLWRKSSSQRGSEESRKSSQLWGDDFLLHTSPHLTPPANTVRLAMPWASAPRCPQDDREPPQTTQIEKIPERPHAGGPGQAKPDDFLLQYSTSSGGCLRASAFEGQEITCYCKFFLYMCIFFLVTSSK